MKKQILLILTLFLNLSINNIQAQENELLSFVVYGESFTVGVALPNTWIVDMDYAARVGVNGIFFQRNNPSLAVIILGIVNKPENNSNLDEWIQYDTNAFLEYYRDFRLTKLDWSISSIYNYRMEIYMFENTRTGQIQYCVYFDPSLQYFAKLYITLTTNNDIINERLVEDFKRCLINTRFTGIGIRIEN